MTKHVRTCQPQDMSRHVSIRWSRGPLERAFFFFEIYSFFFTQTEQSDQVLKATTLKLNTLLNKLHYLLPKPPYIIFLHLYFEDYPPKPKAINLGQQSRQRSGNCQLSWLAAWWLSLPSLLSLISYHFLFIIIPDSASFCKQYLNSCNGKSPAHPSPPIFDCCLKIFLKKKRKKKMQKKK